MYMNDPSINKYESLLDILHAFSVGDTFHDQLFALHGPVEIKENDGKRTSMECLACQVSWPCHTYRILEAWGRNEARSKPIIDTDNDKRAQNDAYARAVGIRPVGMKNTIGPLSPETLQKHASSTFPKSHGFQRSLFYPGSPYCSACNLPRENAIHWGVSDEALEDETVVKEADQGRADNVRPHIFEANDLTDDTTCRICHLPPKNAHHIHAYLRPGMPDEGYTGDPCSICHLPASNARHTFPNEPHPYKSYKLGWESGDKCTICNLTYAEGYAKGLHREPRVGEITETEDRHLEKFHEYVGDQTQCERCGLSPTNPIHKRRH